MRSPLGAVCSLSPPPAHRALRGSELLANYLRSDTQRIALSIDLTGSASTPGSPRTTSVQTSIGGRAVVRMGGEDRAAGLRVESEVGSGVNGSRAKARRLLADPRIQTFVVERRDRLGGMNVELLEAALEAHGRRLVVLDEGEVDHDLVRDLTEVLTSFCARLYGGRSARRRAEKALRKAAEEPAS